MSTPRDEYRTLWRYAFRSLRSSNLTISLHIVLIALLIGILSSNTFWLMILGPLFPIGIGILFWNCTNRNYNGKDGCP